MPVLPQLRLVAREKKGEGVKGREKGSGEKGSVRLGESGKGVSTLF